MSLRITKVYTRQGDNGETRLGGGQLVAKDSVRIAAYGTVDELSSVIGTVVAFTPHERVLEALTRIQQELFTVGGDLCVLEEDKQGWDMPTIKKSHIEALETLMDRLNEELEPLKDFILPGGTRAASFLHQARCVCRRAERLVVELSRSGKIGDQIIPYLNRLSDTLFVLARYENLKAQISETYWEKDPP